MNIIHHKSSSTVGRTLGVLGILACLLSTSVAQAGGVKVKCYKFNSPDVGTRFEKEQTLDLRHAKFNFQQFLGTNGEPSRHPDQRSEIASYNVPGGEGPSLRMISITTQIVPKNPIQKIRLKYSENTGGAPYINFGVNGQREVLQGGLAQVNGRTFGKPILGGSAQVSVTAEPVEGGNYVSGTLEVNAAQGATIKYIAFGGHNNFFVDNVCMFEQK